MLNKGADGINMVIKYQKYILKPLLPRPSTDRIRKHKLGLSFPPRNLPIKFGLKNPSAIILVIVVTDRHTDRQTNAGKNMLHRFRGEN